MKRSFVRFAGAAGALTLALAATGCSGSSSGSDSASEGKASITFWGWAPGYEDAVKAFNAGHPDIEVTYQTVQPGAKGGYQKMLNAVKAGNAPCLAQVGYETMPSFAAQGALEDVAKHAASAKGDYQSAAWNAVSLGSAVYGAPVDTGPMALFYNKKLFDSLGLEPPTTWAEYREAGKKIHASDPKRFLSSPYLDYDYAGLAWQAGADWFGVDDDAWKVSMASAENKKVADYWQGLVEDGLISSAPMYDQAWYTGLGNGNIATVVGAVWQAGVIKGGAKQGAGQWAVAPMPQWEKGDKKVGNAGGSATAVLKGCKNTAAAWEFAHWLSTDKDTFGKLIEKASLYPAANALLYLPQLKADPYFGGQRIYDVFATATPGVDPGWTWGPLMPSTVADLNDGLGKAWTGKGTIAQALSHTQETTMAEMRKQGLAVAP
ncbi:sugar ABC transporter substrate-binding protein [Streptomyces sp. NK15101]|uniref:ABC transporter substrate-binding protein n=1 Tax=Streptomyces sp. NK15101 TaxID=2873261 RepID=UPI001CEC8E04|nr:sugar ABC transporter substrate-binding protein [Streptomyces sp. NK15101]